MKKNIRLFVSLVLCLVFIYSLSIQSTYASTLSGAKNTISTSRPSASTPLYLDQAINDTSTTVIDNNSVFLASDSAAILPDAGETITAGIKVASMSGLIQSPQPLSYWKFDENTGASVGDSLGGNTGTWNGTLGSQWTTGKVNSGGNFNGSNNYISLSQNFNYQLNSFSMSVWFKTSTSGDVKIISTNATNHPIQLISGNLRTCNVGCTAGATVVNNNVWHLAVVVGNVSSIKVYLDGNASPEITQGPSSTSITGATTFGAISGGSSYFFPGQLDEIGYWDRALSTSEISRIYNSGTGAPYPNFVTNTRTVYFSSSISNPHHQGDTVIAPVTAKHIIQFTPITGVASTGKIVVSFPGIGSNSASPSATTFAFNNLQASNISTTGASCGSYTLSPPNITCNLNASLSPGTPVTMTIGSTTPALVNPTKTNVAGTADAWRMTLQTTDVSGVVLDDAKIAIATVDSVRVYGDVDPSITFTITGVNNGVALSTQASGCADSTQNAQSTTPTEVNLGFLRNGQINMAAQLLSVSTNGAQGYVISATSSGKLQNPTTGWGIYGMNGDIGLSANDTPVPATFRASGFEGFGISACGPRTGVNSNQWGASSCTTTFSSGCKYANPWNTGSNSYYSTLASYSGGPVSNDLTVVKYAATISGTTPPGNYRTVFTYVATATF